MKCRSSNLLWFKTPSRMDDKENSRQQALIDWTLSPNESIGVYSLVLVLERRTSKRYGDRNHLRIGDLTNLHCSDSLVMATITLLQ